jgi:Family of unknown function (DUF5670)
MLVKTGLILLIAWLVGILGLFQAGDLVHILLLVGLMLLMLGVLKARDAAAAERHIVAKPPDK